MFKVLKDAGYHIAALAPRGDLFGAGVTELCVNEVSCILGVMSRTYLLVRLRREPAQLAAEVHWQKSHHSD
jgi:hypothetical protein